jgi:tRNA(adenine34) deaminase
MRRTWHQINKVMPTNEDLHFMRLAVQQANRGATTPGGAEVGCVLVFNGIAAEADYNETQRLNDPTAHSEIVAIRSLCARLERPELRGYTLYCTLQPCGMCTFACVWAGISRIVYGATRKNVNTIYFDTRHSNTADLIGDCYRDDIKIEGGVLEEECCRLYLAPNEDASDLVNPAHQATLV